MIKKFDFDKVEHTKKIIQFYDLERSKLLLAVSGGADSIILAHHMKMVAQNFPEMQLMVMYVHHGLTSDKKINDYRNHALEFVKNFAQKEGIAFATNKVEQTHLLDEDSMRKYREEEFKKLSGTILVKGHHREDLLETRLIRLIRGTGPEGIVAMSEFDGKNLRPLLRWSRIEILDYARNYNLEFIDDPSNRDENYLRNWIRHHWLESLEKYRPGSRESLMKSLENIAEHFSQDSVLQDTIDEHGIIKSKLLVLKKADQRRVFAYYLNQLRVENYTSTQIDEVLKHLDRPQKELTFNVANCVWKVDTKHISALKKKL